MPTEACLERQHKEFVPLLNAMFIQTIVGNCERHQRPS
jgi:hypothetical protein